MQISKIQNLNIKFTNEQEIVDNSAMDEFALNTIFESNPKNNSNPPKTPAQKIADSLYNDIHQHKMFILPTTGDEIGSHIKQINKTNVIDVIDAYTDKSGSESLINAIMAERGLPEAERLKYIDNIFKSLVEAAKAKGVGCEDIEKEYAQEVKYQKESKILNGGRISSLVDKLELRIKSSDKNTNNIVPNGKVDENFKQGSTGDCWLLAAVKAITLEPKGQKILDDAIKVDDKGNVTVFLKGVNKKYTFTPAEIGQNTQMSKGDLDVRAIEMAIDKYFNEQKGVSGFLNRGDFSGGFSINDGNSSHVAFELLTGKGGRNVFGNTVGRAKDIIITDNDIDQYNKPNRVTCVANSLKGKDLNFTDGNGNKQTLYRKHVYSVHSSDDKNVYVINPWDTSKIISVPRETFKKFFNTVDQVDL